LLARQIPANNQQLPTNDAVETYRYEVASFSRQNHKDFETVISLLMPVILCFTVIASVGLGVLAAYIAVFGILGTFRHPSQPEPVPARPRLVLVPTQTHASGD
jgi:hypothetical protein